MNARGDNPPAWLFSFVDLAFLLLIAMTQLGRGADAPDLGEILVPRLHSEGTSELPSQAAERWQLRVHPRGEPDAGPFQLVRSGDPAEPSGAERLALELLRPRLAGLHADGTAKPLLAPHRDSRSEDLLEAVGALEELWAGRRRATVAPALLAGT